MALPFPFHAAGLDYLSSPSGVIAEAQRLAAVAFGADNTWFLVNGCTVGVLAAVLSCAGPGDTLMVARNCHLSAFSAMVLSGTWIRCGQLHGGWILPASCQSYRSVPVRGAW